MSDKLRQVDVRSKKPHTRHLAVISRIRVPRDGRVLDGEIAITVCGKAVRNYWVADGHGYLYTDGSVYAVACSVCLPEEVMK